MTTRKYDYIYIVWKRSCESLYGVLQRLDVCPFCHTANIDCNPPRATLVQECPPKQMQLPSKCVVSICRCLLAKVPHTLNPYCVPIKRNHMVSDTGILGATSSKGSLLDRLFDQSSGKADAHLDPARTALWKWGVAPILLEETSTVPLSNKAYIAELHNNRSTICTSERVYFFCEDSVHAEIIGFEF